MFVDPTRGTPANGTAPMASERHLSTEIWYPASTSDTSPDSVTRDAPVDPTGRPYPLLIYVHGSSGSRRTSAFLPEALARAGYVVAAADFPLTASTTPGGASDLHVDDQLGDLSFLADQLAARAADAKDLFAGAVDPKTGYAVAGHSTGGTVALLAAFAPDVHDPRLKAAIALAPCACFFGDSFFTTRSLPLLVAAGTDDLLVPIANNGARAYALARAPKILATIVGGTHLYFTDFAIPDDALHPSPTTAHDDIAKALARYGGGTVCEPVPPPASDPILAVETQHQVTIDLVRAFLDANLRARAGLLDAIEKRPPAALRILKE